MDAVRSAYERTLTARLGAFLDDTTRLRYELQNGDAVIDEIRALRGASCTPAAFSPPQKVDAAIVGEWNGKRREGTYLLGHLRYPML